MLPTTFKAAVLETAPGQLKIKNIKMPEPKYGQIIVKVKMAGICHSQLMEAQGNRGEDKYLPHLMGHEGVGDVIAVGEGVTKTKVGDRVILGWIKADGIDAGGVQVESAEGEVINGGPVTTFSEYTLVSENRITVCPEGISDELAVLLGCALPTGAGMVLNQVKPRENSSIVLLGLGGIGLSALMMLNHFSPKKVVVVDVEEKKLELAKKLGATDVFLATDNVVETLKSEFPEGFDYAIESAGRCNTIELAFELIHNQGICYFASHPPSGEKIQLDPHQLISGKRIFGTWGGNCAPDVDLEKISNIVEKLDLPLDNLTTKYQLQEINSAFDDLANRKIIRALVELGQ